MSDPYLQAMLHGDFLPNRKKKTDKFDEAISHFAKKYVESLNLEELPSSLESVALKKQKLVEELKEQARFEELIPYLDRAYSVIYGESEAILGNDRFKTLESELTKAGENVEALKPMEPIADDLNAIFSLSQDSLDMILELALKKFTNEEYEDCLSLCIFLTTTCPYVPSYWFRQGIAAQRAKKIDIALASYRNALRLLPSLTGAHLFAAECYYYQGKSEEALQHCQEAETLLAEEGIEEVWHEFQKHLADELKTSVHTQDESL